MVENVYTDEQLLQYLKDFYIENNKVPITNDFRKRKPNTGTFILRFGSWNNAVEQAGLKKEKYQATGYSDKELVDFLLDYYNKFNKIPTSRDFKSNKDYPSSGTYEYRFGSWKNALIKAGLFDLREDKCLFDRKEYSDEEMLNLLNEFIITNDRIPFQDEISKTSNMPHVSTYVRHFGSYEQALTLLGYDYDQIKIRIPTDKLIIDLQKLYKELGRTPTSRDMEFCKWCCGSGAYMDRFGSIYNALDVANIPYLITSRLLSNDEIIDYWYHLKNKLKRIPTLKDISNSEIDIYSSIKTRWNSYTEFLNSINEKSNYNKYGCKVYLTKNKTKCFSYYEFTITSWLEDHNIIFDKDFLYKNVIKDDDTMRTFDWVIYNNNNIYCVECFGVIGNDKYQETTKNKISDCQKNNIKLICIYPDDFKKPIEKILSFIKIAA